MKPEEMTVAKYNDLMMSDALKMLSRRYKDLEKQEKRMMRKYTEAQKEQERVTKTLQKIENLTDVVFEQLRLPI